jgi:hypothetical protein
MTTLKGMYDPNADPSGGFEVLPAGVYTVKVESGIWKETKAKDGQYLQMNFAVVEGDHQESLLVHRFNLKNRNEQATRIANGEFKSLCLAIGVPEPMDIEDLKGVRFQVAVKCEKRSDDPDKMGNRITRFIKKESAPSAPQQNGEAPPWKRNAPPVEAAASFPDTPF